MVEPGQYARITEIENTLESKQAAVGGLITCAYPWEELVCIVANDEGLINGMPLNRYVKDYQVLAGPFFVCGITEDTFCDLTDEQAERYRQMFLRPEMFLRYRNGIARIQYDNPHLPGAPEEVAERIRQRNGVPDLCFTVHPMSGKLIMRRYGDYWGQTIPPLLTNKSNRECADELNEKLGVSKAQKKAMLHASVCGWDSPLPPSYFEEKDKEKMMSNKPNEREER